MALLKGGGKLPGKTDYFGRRRPMTRKSGFTVGEYSGNECETLATEVWDVQSKNPLVVTFTIPQPAGGQFACYGGWYRAHGAVTVQAAGEPIKGTLTTYPTDCWNKFGSMWDSGPATVVTVTFSATKATRVSLFKLACGTFTHPLLEKARKEHPVLLRNMQQFSPEAHFAPVGGGVRYSSPPTGAKDAIVVRACNRCDRFLPLNLA